MLQDGLEVVLFVVSNSAAFVVLLVLSFISFRWEAARPKLVLWGLTLASGLALWMKDQTASAALDPLLMLQYQKLSIGWMNSKSINFLGINSLDLAALLGLVAQIVRDERTAMFGLLMTFATISGLVWLATFTGLTLAP